MKLQIILIFSVYLVLNSVLTQTIDSNLVNNNVERTIDLTSQLAKVSIKITLKNSGTQPIKNFLLYENPKEKGILAYIIAKDTSKQTLQIDVQGKQRRIHLQNPLLSGKTTIVNVEYVLAKSLEPYPAKITQRERQLVRFITTQHFYSPYATTEDKTTFKLSSRNIESYTKVKPVSQNDQLLTYGPNKNVEPLSEVDVLVHFENNSPFLTVTNLVRTIEVSHWGNIAIEEHIDLLHTGAQLKGSFSRYEYQRDSNSGLASIKSFKTILPASASDAYYRDNNGNISTSHMKIKRDAVELDLRPRFPLFGGWKTQYTLGYNVPSYEYLFHSGDEYLLKMRLIDHIFDDMLVDRVTTTIILPEGSTNLNLKTPYPVKRHPDTLHYTYLDMKGRPVVSFSKEFLVENHIQDFELSYNFPRLLMLQEPLLVFGALYILFLVIIVYVRLDFSITKEKKE
ncbi:dolichyl-diphosphooligosaccharide--protein glycosyltransferase subunit 1 [Chrysoperla carnea]|uniref:dolichyl-diphosphooligosaccharide--protein glycosyltransferase subunit 1 n=1 Tax=Chrysoperla carnea TaxID=189513 RepID=UPI001D071656|nr:dolichyl-diphosphooligosaccharide--protein glycosyltransferase subunit 1 [Chrysoperla carnea]